MPQRKGASYVLNNPLKFIDPDGRKDEEYTVRILNKDVKVTISERITDENIRAQIKGNIQNMADYINDKAEMAKSNPETALTEAEIKIIHGMTGIKVNLEGEPGMNNGTFEVPAYYALHALPGDFAADVIHDSYHVKQWNYACGGERGKRFERKASTFTLGVIKKLNLIVVRSKHIKLTLTSVICAQTQKRND